MDFSDKHKVQYISENVLLLIILLATLISSFYSQRDIITIVLIIIIILLIIIFKISREKGKWFKSKDKYSISFTISQGIIISILLRMSYDKKIPIFIGITYPVLIFIYTAIINYRFNFK